MSRKKLETIVLIVGSLIFIAGLILLLTRGDNPNNTFINNLVFAAGFLIYIVYSVMNTSSLQKEITGLQEEVEELSAKLQATTKELESTKNELTAKTTELKQSQEENNQLKEQVAALEQKVTELTAQLEKKHKVKGPEES